MGSLAAAAPNVLMLGIFYSLALHMWSVLGGWPSSIGNRGFPAALAWHGDLAIAYSGLLLQFSMVLVPLALLWCSFSERRRRALP